MNLPRIGLKLFTRSFSSSSTYGTKVCVIGSGPAGFYFAQHLIKLIPDVQVDIYEKLPVPFGLVRYGVAPDHPEVKNVINTFTKTAHLKNVRFIGNVTLGRDVSFKEFQEAYHAVVLSYGCSEDRRLGIEGEDLDNVLSAREIVGWYNGLPDSSGLRINLQTDTAVVLGQGNVAVDVARILLSPIDLLRKTDVPEAVLAELSLSRIKRVFLAGRRGPLQAAFTIKEFREMTKLPDCSTVLDTDLFHQIRQFVPDLPRARKRLTELMIKTSETKQSGSREFHPVFFRKPFKIVGISLPESVLFHINTPVDHIKGEVKATKNEEEISAGLVVRSVGYRGIPADPDIPWCQELATVSTTPGVYGVGWIGSGPVGVILSTMSNAFAQAEKLVTDISQGKIAQDSRPGFPSILQLLQGRDVTTVNFEGWEKIDQVEVQRGTKLGKPREKIIDIKEMLRIANQ